MTLNELLIQLQTLKDVGCGDYKIRIPDGSDNITLDMALEQGVYDVCKSEKIVMLV